MAQDLNTCMFIGRLGADPEVRYQTSGDAVANFRIAVGWKTKDKEGTEWVSIVAFGKLAELAGEYLHKGKRIFVSGRFRTRKWQGQDGSDRYSTEIVAEKIQFLDTKESSGEGTAKKTEQPAKPSPSAAAGFDDFQDDEIPF